MNQPRPQCCQYLVVEQLQLVVVEVVQDCSAFLQVYVVEVQQQVVVVVASVEAR